MRNKNILVLVAIFGLLGFVMGLVGIDLRVPSREEKVFLRVARNNLEGELIVRDIFPGAWSEFCIFIAKDSYPKFAMQRLNEHLLSSGFSKHKENPVYPVMLLLKAEGNSKAIGLSSNKIQHNGIDYYISAPDHVMQEKHAECVAFDRAFFAMEKGNGYMKYQLNERNK